MASSFTQDLQAIKEAGDILRPFVNEYLEWKKYQELKAKFGGL